MKLDQNVLQRLNDIGIALSKETHITRLLEKILLHAKELLEVDGGTIYTISGNDLHFEILVSDSLRLKVGGTSQIPSTFANLPLVLPDGKLNERLIVTYAVNHKKTINIKDAYVEEGFDFSGTRQFDRTTGYRTKSVLTVPILDHEARVVAVLQLINPINQEHFTDSDAQFAESLASQAGVALTNQRLILNLRKLFESLIRVLAEAIDEKSPSTGNHSKRVPLITAALAEAVNHSKEGIFKETHFTPQELYELNIASFLHDCGKVTTPVYLEEKKNKLETVFDQIEVIRTRYMALQEKTEKEIAIRKLQWLESHYPKEFMSAREEFIMLDKKLHTKLATYKKELDLLQKINEGSEKMTPELCQRLHHMALQSVDHQPLLTPKELESLCVEHGNLTEEEWRIMRHHVVMTYRMLSQLELPRELRRVPEIAAAHHERVDGKGYPLGLKKEEMSLQARILAIADVFEALSSPDRPYKKNLKLSEVFKIMQEMATNGHLDPDLYDLFIKQKVYLPYAQQYLDPSQLDI